MKEFDTLIAIVQRLRKECPWDKEQSLQSLRPFLIEETYEVLEALDRLQVDPTAIDPLCEEWGDLLLQIILQSVILCEREPAMSLATISERLTQKLIRRHPHVFADKNMKSSADVKVQWDALKAEERKSSSPSAEKSLMADIQPKAPALLHALKIGERSHKVKFDWPSSQEVWKQVLSELQELEKEILADDEKKPMGHDKMRQEEELGDLLFSLVQWARHQKIDPEVALAKANRKFLARFALMETWAREKSQNFQEISLHEKEALWKRAKEKLKSP